MTKKPRPPRIVVIGGGTGTFAILGDLKKLSPDITALVNMSDDGGSTGVLRDELGVLPPGDIRQCLVALSDVPELRDLFNYRFSGERFGGHSVGNLILSALELQYHDFGQAVEVASRILRITGRVLPMSLDKHTLMMSDGEDTVEQQYTISHRAINHRNAKVYLSPAARINPKAARAIELADMIVIAPGNLYGSLLPALAVDGVAKALATTKALVIMVSNLVTKPGQTTGWHVVDYVKVIEEYIGQDQVDVVLYNNHPPTKSLLKKYATDGEFPVDSDKSRFTEIRARAVGAPMVAGRVAPQNSNDTIVPRTLIRHDGRAVADELRLLLHEEVQ